ncbi:MAG TPA: magnesium/cobalt transporter CorA [Opitutaceae bacterium]|nr:magnesium/cobalt transporter CorA [Opitutaceae bacterium]
MIHSFIFSDGRLVGQDLELEALRLVRADKGLLLWVNLENPTEDEIKSILENVFQFHPLAIEDCIAPNSLPKVEDYEDYLFLVSHGVDYSRTEKFNTTELSVFLGKEYVVTFHRQPLRSIQAVRERCAKNIGGIRSADRLAHLILDLLTDNYKPVVDELRGEIEEIEETVLAKSAGDLTPALLQLKSEISHLRQIVRPQRDVINRLAHGESKIIRPTSLPYFRDVRDNLIRIEETAAGFADQLLISFDLYLNKSSFEANEGIKVLTALTAITLPAVVIGTWYGMNFEHMPELDSPYGYYGCIAATAVLTVLMWRWCKRKKFI